MKLFTVFFSLLFTVVLLSPADAQLSQGGTPKSFTTPGLHSVVPVLELSKPDLTEIIKEDKVNDAANKAYRAGVILPVSINPDVCGVWDYLPDGSAIWRVKVAVADAEALCLYFSEYALLPGMELFVYTPDKAFLIGSFTEFNNHESGLMATQDVPKNEAIIELFIPDRTASFGFNIDGVGYFYRGVFYNNNKSSGGCEVNVVCPEGTNWTNQIRSVAQIREKIGASVYFCSGSLMNNTSQNCTPYFLLADHCSVGSAVVTAAELLQWVFKFNYQSTTCNGTIGTTQSLTGCTYRASDSYGQTQTGPDFFLCELNNDVPTSYNPWYNGWSYQTATPTSGVGIHHPNGDIKKISTWSGGATSYTTHWGVKWISTVTNHGVTEGGSSGSPLYDQNKRVVGTLTGGGSACSTDSAGTGTGPNVADIYGKIAKQWLYNSATDKQLKCWLDPSGASSGTLDGRNYCVAGLDDVAYIRANIHLYPNPATEYLSIDFSDYNIENGTMFVTDMLGKTVSASVSGDFTSNESLDVRELEPGMYFLMIHSQNINVSLPFVVE